MSKSRLSKRQEAMLGFINRFSEENGYPPTIREIGAAVSIPSTSVVKYNLEKLGEYGFISRLQKVSRAIRVMGENAQTQGNFLAVPLVGQIVAGLPTPYLGDDLDYYDEDSMLPVPRSFIGNTDPREIYALTVNGLSMIDAMIDDGDIVVLKRQKPPRTEKWLPSGLRRVVRPRSSASTMRDREFACSLLTRP